MRWLFVFLCGALLIVPACGTTISPSTQAINEGIRQEKDGDTRAALASFDQAVALDPANFRAYFYRGQFLYHRGDNEDALADVNRTLALKADFPEAYQLRGLIEIGKGDLAAGSADMAKMSTMVSHELDQLPVKPGSRQATCKISDDSIDVGDTAVVTIRLLNCDSDITRYPLPDGLQIVEQSSYMKSSVKSGYGQREADFTFKLKAVRPGDYLIPAFTLPQKSGEVVVPAVRLKVSS